MKLSTYLHFDGKCEEAINFYKDVLDGEISTFMRFSEAPEDMCKHLPEDALKLVMHATLEVRGATIHACDYVNDKTALVAGNNFAVSINVSDDEEGYAIFNGLADGGNISMPLSNAFWGGKFGMLTDKFDINWMLTTEHKPM